LFYGVRTVWRVRLAIAFLFFVWPWPYEYLIDRWLAKFTNLTIAALGLVVRGLPVASQVAGGDGSVFTIAHAGAKIEMSVASACSGANGLLGFLLVGGAFVVSMRGRVGRKLAWLGIGSLVVWALNLARILIIFEAARRWGEKVAIDGFHPFTGLIVFNLGVLLMVIAMPVFGLRLPPRTTVTDPAAMPRPPGRTLRTLLRGVRAARPKLAMAMVVVLTATAVVGVRNDTLRDNDLVASSLGSPRLSAFASSRERPAGWKLAKTGQFGWARKYFGASSSWLRYSYVRNQKESTAGLEANVGVVADVIETSDRAALSAYGVESCYKFHDYRVSRQQSVSLGSGIVGGLLSWTDPGTSQTWTTLYWHWPVKTATGTRYERITLLVGDNPSNAFTVFGDRADELSRNFDLRVNDLLRGGNDQQVSDRLLQTGRFVVAFARDLITRRVAA
jgi:exosortase/archaeosortase family protein